ncbi:MAG: hypothetical protein ACI92G_002436 [Candidatus Pelagisphaera sp.]|jgi:hypothetical protein
MNLKLVSVDSDNRAMPQIWEKNILTHMFSLEHTWLMPLAKHLKQHCSQVYEGTEVGVLNRSELLAPKHLELLQTDRNAECLPQPILGSDFTSLPKKLLDPTWIPWRD